MDRNYSLLSTSCRRRVAGGRQRGAIAIEFALVFVVFFAVFYGIISYSLPFLLLQSFNSAAAEGARAGLAVERYPQDTYETRVLARAREVAAARLTWLSADGDGNSRTEIVAELDGNVLRVEVRYDYQQRPLVPSLHLPLVGAVPRLPEHLGARAGVEL